MEDSLIDGYIRLKRRQNKIGYSLDIDWVKSFRDKNGYTHQKFLLRIGSLRIIDNKVTLKSRRRLGNRILSKSLNFGVQESFYVNDEMRRGIENALEKRDIELGLW